MLLYSPTTELRLFGALMTEPQVLAWCDAVEIDDFSCMHLANGFVALRNIQARGEEASTPAVIDELQRTGYIGVDAARIAEAAFEPAYNGEEMLVRLDAQWLRRMANRRRNAA